MTPENQPETGLAKKAYGMIKGAGHSFKRATLGDIYALIETSSNEARQHREENFRYLTTRIDSLAERMDGRIDALDKKIDDHTAQLRQEIGAVRQEVGSVNQRIDTLGQKVDDQIGQLRQEMNTRLDTIMQILIDLSKQRS